MFRRVFADPPLLCLQPARFACSSGRRCGEPAVVICFSCVRFDVGRGHYCRSCFDIYHPWYRVAHKWVPVEDAEGARKQMEQQAYRTTIERTVADLRILLRITSSWVGELESQDADTKVRRRACCSVPSCCIHAPGTYLFMGNGQRGVRIPPAF